MNRQKEPEQKELKFDGRKPTGQTEQGDNYWDVNPTIIAGGGCNHFFVKYSKRGPDGLQEYRCNKCPQGILLKKGDRLIKGKPIYAKRTS